tara:strand:+ start:84 stop:437 length:354 start_codon:yes stop_codon:yes gene_type:complete
MAAPEHLTNIIKVIHSDAVVANGGGTAKAVQARELLLLLEGIPPAPVNDIISEVLRDFVEYVTRHPDGFRVGGENSANALMRVFAKYQEDRGFTVSYDALTVEGLELSWTSAIGLPI